MQARKSKKKTDAFQPWYMLWLFYILNLFSRQAQVAHIPPQLLVAPASPAKKKKSPASTHKKISNEKLATKPKVHSHK